MEIKNPMHPDHRGSALISVVVSMLFLLALGLGLLLVSYTSLQVSATQKSEKETFYSAEAVLEDIRLGLQTLLSDAVSPAYTRALAQNPGEEAAQNLFNQELLAELSLKKSGSTPYFSNQLSGYSAEALKGFIRAEARDYVSLSGKGTVRKVYDQGILQSFSLEGLSLQYLKSGFETRITTDLRIELPAFRAALSPVPGIGDYALITNGRLTNQLSAGTAGIIGSVFAEEGLALSGDHKLTLENGDLITRGPIQLENTASLIFNARERELWAESLQIKGVSGEAAGLTKASLEGKIYLADDLILEGSNIAVTLKNNFFGFGGDADRPEKSSAISVQGGELKQVSLDFTGLDSLYLAGTAFLDLSEAGLSDLYGNTPFTKPLILGQSAAFDFSSQDYFVPPEAVKNYEVSAYPFVLRPEGIGLPEENEATDGPGAQLPQLDLDAVLWQKEGQDKRLSDYLGEEKGRIKSLYRSENGQKLVFLYLDFAGREAANAYFEDYFAANYTGTNKAEPEILPKSEDLSLLLPEETSRVSTAGGLFHTPKRESSETEKNLSDWALHPAAKQIFAEDLQARYENFSSPYALYVNTEALSKLIPSRNYEFRNEANELVAVVSTMENYSPPNPSLSGSQLRLVIARQNIILSNDFRGLVLAGGDIVLKAKAQSAALAPSLAEAVCTDGGTSYRLADFIKNSSRLFGTGREAWNLNELVVFENWKKG